MTEFAYKLTFENNQQDRKPFVVLFACLAFILSILFPTINSILFNSCLCFAAYLLILRQYQKLCPLAGEILLNHQDSYLEVHAQTEICGKIISAHRFLNALCIGVYTHAGEQKKLIFLQSALTAQAWSRLCRIALAAND